MAEPESTPSPFWMTGNVPAGLLAELTTSGARGLRHDAVARARRQAVDRAYDDGAVLEAIASRLLSLSDR